MVIHALGTASVTDISVISYFRGYVMAKPTVCKG